MDEADRGRVAAFLEKWQGSEGNERANYQTFFGDWCRALGVAGPPPKGSEPGDPYCFDKDIKFFASDKTEATTRYADFYKAGCPKPRWLAYTECNRPNFGFVGDNILTLSIQAFLN